MDSAHPSQLKRRMLRHEVHGLFSRGLTSAHECQLKMRPAAQFQQGHTPASAQEGQLNTRPAAQSQQGHARSLRRIPPPPPWPWSNWYHHRPPPNLAALSATTQTWPFPSHVHPSPYPPASLCRHAPCTPNHRSSSSITHHQSSGTSTQFRCPSGPNCNGPSPGPARRRCRLRRHHHPPLCQKQRSPPSGPPSPMPRPSPFPSPGGGAAMLPRHGGDGPPLLEAD